MRVHVFADGLDLEAPQERRQPREPGGQAPRAFVARELEGARERGGSLGGVAREHGVRGDHGPYVDPHRPGAQREEHGRLPSCLFRHRAPLCVGDLKRDAHRVLLQGRPERGVGLAVGRARARAVGHGNHRAHASSAAASSFAPRPTRPKSPASPDAGTATTSSSTCSRGSAPHLSRRGPPTASVPSAGPSGVAWRAAQSTRHHERSRGDGEHVRRRIGLPNCPKQPGSAREAAREVP
jgi:hypothetical protein